MVRIQLDSVKKYSNKSEYRRVNRASAEGFKSVGDGNNVVKLCKTLLENGYSGDCEVYRGDMLVFAAAPIERWAGDKIGRGEQPEWLKNED